jgi:UDP-GlcNAc:undecaprenyl-phosphate GlcNAc-1-phosphate transferase
MTTYIGIFLVAFLVATLVTPWVSRLAYKVGAIDVPGGRKFHERITPRLGGLSVLAGFLVAMGAGIWASPVIARSVDPAFWGVLLGGLIIVALGIYDDIHGATAGRKFPFQFLAAHVAYSSGVRFHLLTNVLFLMGFGGEKGWMLGEGLAYVATILWLVGVTNALNFIDGLDALASGLSFIVSTSLLVVALTNNQVFYAAVYAALMGAVFGFGHFNKYPARIFLGDTGSTFLGFVLAGSAVLANHKATALGSLVIPVVVLGVPVADTFYAIFRRFVGGRSPFEADRGHIHHRLLELGYTPKEAVWVIYLLSIALSAAVFFLINAQNDFTALVIVLLSAGAFTMARKLELLHLDRFQDTGTFDPRVDGFPEKDDGEQEKQPEDEKGNVDETESEA